MELYISIRMVNLEISVFSDEFSLDFEKVAQYLQTQNVHYVELRGLWKSNILTLPDDERGKLKDLLKQYDLKVSSISGGLLKCTPPTFAPNPPNNKSISANWKYNYSLVENALNIAKELDAPFIRCFGFHGHWKIEPMEKWGSWSVYQEWSEKIKELKSKAAAMNKTFVCENEGGLDQSLGNIERIGKDHCAPGFGILFDMANVANKFGKNGILTDEWLGRIAKYIKFVHAKGCAQNFLSRHTTFVNAPKDICNWPAVVKYFRNMKFSEFIGPAPNPLFLSIETHMGGKNAWNNSVQSLQNLIQILKNN